MPDSSDGVGISVTGVSRLAPQPSQNWASDGLSQPQLRQSMVELPFPGEQAIDKSDDASGLRARQAFHARSWCGGSQGGSREMETWDGVKLKRGVFLLPKIGGISGARGAEIADPSFFARTIDPL